MTNCENGVVRDRQRSVVKAVTCPERRGAVAGTVAASGNWTKEQYEWARLRTVILNALDEHPGAREAVVRALVKLGDLAEERGNCHDE